MFISTHKKALSLRHTIILPTKNKRMGETISNQDTKQQEKGAFDVALGRHSILFNFKIPPNMVLMFLHAE